jgi:murein DD-endopeptidase MepM/ murein hydrolase activator NlpD
MEKIKKIILFYLILPYFGLGQDIQLENLLSKISTNGEITGFVENCFESKIYPKIPIIPPILSSHKLNTSSKFGYRVHPIYHSIKFHAGIDITTSETDTVITTGDGIIHQIGYESGLGNFIVIQHQYGFMTLYGHLSAIFVKPKQKVSIGQTIGLMGKTGLVTGKHLHYCIIKNGFYLNPFLMMYLFLKVPTQKISSN